MHIAVDDRDPPDAGVALQHATRHRHIVEHAIAFAAVGEGMVGASCEIGSAALRQSPPRAAAIVAPTDRRARSTICGDHGNPIRRCASRGSVPCSTAWTYPRRVHEPQILPRRLRRLVQARRRSRCHLAAAVPAGRNTWPSGNDGPRAAVKRRCRSRSTACGE